MVFLLSLLIFRKTRILIKKLVLINFSIALMIWHIKLNNIFINDELIIMIINFKYYKFTNIIFIFFIDLNYFLWSLVSFKNNLSDWIVPTI